MAAVARAGQHLGVALRRAAGAAPSRDTPQGSLDLDRPLPALGSMFLIEFSDFPMMRRLLQTVRTRAEAEAVRDGLVVALPADGAAISHWAGADAKASYDAAYDASIGLSPVPFEHHDVDGPFGGRRRGLREADGPPVVSSTPPRSRPRRWYLQAVDLGPEHRLYAIDVVGDISRWTQLPRSTRSSRCDLAGIGPARLGLEQVAIVGSSFGGFQAANLAIHRPDLVSAWPSSPRQPRSTVPAAGERR